MLGACLLAPRIDVMANLSANEPLCLRITVFFKVGKDLITKMNFSLFLKIFCGDAKLKLDQACYDMLRICIVEFSIFLSPSLFHLKTAKEIFNFCICVKKKMYFHSTDYHG